MKTFVHICLLATAVSTSLVSSTIFDNSHFQSVSRSSPQFLTLRHRAAFAAENNDDDSDEPWGDDIYAPYKCATCTTLVGLIDQWQVIHNKSGIQGLYDFCSMLPNELVFRLPCRYAVRSMGAKIVELINKGETADYICTAIGVCDVADNGMPRCNVFPLPKGNSMFRVHTQSKSALASRLRRDRKQFSLQTSRVLFDELYTTLHGASPADNTAFDYAAELANFRRQTLPADLRFDPCKMPLVGRLCNYIETIFTLRRPLMDKDRDSFGFQPTLRGYTWRGRDCRDLSWDTYPGRKSTGSDIFFDTDCNGIKGYDWQNGLAWETELCTNTSARGIAVLGDSVSAHFHVPMEYLNASMLSAEILKNLTFVVENEADWPHLSYVTGYEQNTWPIVQPGKTDSIYMRLRERNLCNHRDYQNLGENGASTFDAALMQQSLVRDPVKDKPVILFYAYVGNDVCNRFIDTLDHDTHAAEMRKNLQESFDYFGTHLPNGSYVVVLDIADARFLYDSMHDRIHPIGALRGDVTYTQLYDYFNCLDVSPCRGWLTSNDTLRQLTFERVEVLNEVSRSVVEENKGNYDNYKIYHLPNPVDDMFKAWNASGGEIYQLVEPADGFHPNQFAHGILGGIIWDKLLAMDADIFGPVNPHNDRIKQIFKDQGGH